MSVIGTPTYKLAKFCDKFFKSIINNEYTTKDLISFTKEVEEFDPNLVLTTFVMKSFFTNIPLTETIGLCVKNLYWNQTHIHSLSKKSFDELLAMVMFESFYILDQKCYKQCDVAAMGSPHWLMASCVILPFWESLVRKLSYSV